MQENDFFVTMEIYWVDGMRALAVDNWLVGFLSTNRLRLTDVLNLSRHPVKNAVDGMGQVDLISPARWMAGMWVVHGIFQRLNGKVCL
jgi:hypothetical protein